MGLSPRLRGNRREARQLEQKWRSIPALAGEPVTPSPVRISVTVYPRACGGTHSPNNLLIVETGLSPRLRGNRRWLPGWYGGRRSIPALAGEPDFITG